MNDKLLRAFIEASGYEVEEITEEVTVPGPFVNVPKTMVVDYKVTKKMVYTGVYLPLDEDNIR